jgi:hypothetical protein
MRDKLLLSVDLKITFGTALEKFDEGKIVRGSAKIYKRPCALQTITTKTELRKFRIETRSPRLTSPLITTAIFSAEPASQHFSKGLCNRTL